MIHARCLTVLFAGLTLTAALLSAPVHEGQALGADKKPGAAAANGDVSLEVLNWEETQKRVAAHKGKIVVLDAWSTSCDPCLREFPGLVELHKKYGKDGVVCMSLSCDYAGIKSKPPEFYRERVLTFLKKQGATFPNILSSVAADELFEQMDLASIPAVFVYGRDGKLAKRFDNDNITSDAEEFTYKDVNKLVVELLRK